jgi:hemerythrin-like domain-containing protein
MTVAELTQSYHEVIDELLLLHQEALLLARWPLAMDIWQAFSELLAMHIDVENKQLFVCFDKLCQTPRWPVTLYRHEHEKIITMMAQVEQRLKALVNAPSRRQTIALLDYQRSFKNVIEHHEEREEIALLAELMQVISPLEEQQLQEQIQANWPEIARLHQRCQHYAEQLDGHH